MIRAIKLSLKFATAHKKEQVANLLHEYSHGVNFYIGHCDYTEEGKAASIYKLSGTRLTSRYKGLAFRQAINILKACRKTCEGVPVYSRGALLDEKVAKLSTLEDGATSFNLFLKLSTLKSGHPITIPVKRTAMLNKWLGKPGAVLKQGGILFEDQIIVWVEVPTPLNVSDRNLGIDIGINKLIVDSTGKMYGTEFKRLRDKMLRKKPGSKAAKRSQIERNEFVNRAVKQLPWHDIGSIAVEDLKHLKRGKRGNRTKGFRRKLAPWSYRQVLSRVEQKAEENGVHLLRVDPRYTSQTCPACSMVSKLNRVGESFRCVSCGYAQDADVVGACNVFNKAFVMTTPNLGSVGSPKRQKPTRKLKTV